MNDRLVDDIFELIRTMNPAEVESFEKFVTQKGKGKKTSAELIKYLELFRIYNSLRENPEVKRIEIEKLAAFTSGFDDVNQHLCKRLESFLAITYSEERGKSVKEIETKLDTIAELIARKRLHHAGELIVNVANEITSLPSNQFDESYLYLSLRLYALQNNWHIRQLLTKRKIERLDAFEELIRPFNTLARFVPRIVRDPDNTSLERLGSPTFQESSFYGILAKWLRENEHFEQLKKVLPERDRIASLFVGHRSESNVSNAKNKNRALDQLIDGFDTIVRLEKMFLSVKTGNHSEFREQVEALLRSDNLFHNPEKFNPELTAFVYSQIFRFTVLSEQGSGQDFMKRLVELDHIAKTDLSLFIEEQVEDITYRLELNQVIIWFLQKNYGNLIELLSSIGFETKHKRFEIYFADIISIELLSRLQLGMFDDDTEKLIRKYEHFLKPSVSGANIFHELLRKVITRFSRTGSTSERGKIVREYFNELDISQDQKNHYHKVIVLWLQDNFVSEGLIYN